MSRPEYIAVKDFERFQHYKGRTPPWIKFYNSLLDDYKFLQLSDAARSQLMLIWLVASRHNNRIPRDEKYIAEAIHCTSKLQLGQLIESGWLYPTSDSAPLAERKQTASGLASIAQAKCPQSAYPEGEVEVETEEEIETEVSNRKQDQSGEEALARDESANQNGAPPRVVLPREATAFLAQFYEPAFTEAARKRYRDIQAQLYDVLDPKHPGPKIRGGLRVKARSVEHLVDELNAVMRDPPPDRDLAIVWLLKRLTNPPKGPSVTEVKAREEAEARGREDLYHVQAKRAGAAWANEHPDEYQKILASVAVNYTGKTGSFVGMARDAELTQRCAKAAGFPKFEAWDESLQAVPA